MWTANNVHLFGKTATVYFACLNKMLRFMSHVKINDFNLLITFLPLLCRFSNTTNKYNKPTISLEMPVPSQGHYGFHSFPVVD